MLKKAVFFFITGIIILSVSLALPERTIVETGTTTIHHCPSPECQKAYENLPEETVCALYDYKGFTPPKESIIDSEHYKGEGINGSKYSTNHNKYCATEAMVITGSHNPTRTNHKDLVIIINSTTLAKTYKEAYNSLRKGEKISRKGTVNISGTIIEALFCPSQPCREKIIEELSKAKRTIHYLAYSFTDEQVAGTLATSNALVEGILDNHEFKGDQRPTLSKRTLYEYAGKGLLHHKLFIIDSATIITGSANPTKNGYERNDENILIIQSKEMAKELLQEYARIKNESRRVSTLSNLPPR